MRIISRKDEFTFDDILLLPNKSDFTTSEEISRISLKTRISKNISIDIPIMSSPMSLITGATMAIAIARAGGIGVIHPFQTFEQQLAQVREVKREKLKVAASVVSLSDRSIQHIENLRKAGADLISLEMLNVHNVSAISFLKKLKNRLNGIDIMIGVGVTPEAIKDIIRAGADSVRIGIGSGSHCTTRLVTGVGRPQLSAIKECYSISKKYNIPLISDGGIKHPADIIKALVFGAEAVMIGGLFAGTRECPGNIIKRGGQKYKYSYGICTNASFSQIIIKKESAKETILNKIKDYFKSSHMTRKTKSRRYFLEEGKDGLIPYKGDVNDILDQLIFSIRRSMWYQGARDINELRQKARVIFISKNTLSENEARI